VIFDVSGEKKEKECICSDNHLSNYTKRIILLRLSEYCGIIPWTLSRALFHNIHFAFSE